MKEYQVPAGYENVQLCCPNCGYMEGTPPKEANHLYPGTILQNRYQVGVVVGFGGFGITYKAWDWELGITVAIKEFYPSGLVTREPGQAKVIVYEGSHSEEYQKGLERFLEEARRTAQFERSKYIVQVKNFFMENGTAYLVMEYLDGISLKEYLKQMGKLSVKDSLFIADSVIEALREMHTAGILHRDIGPGNIFLCGKTVKIIDFGAARLSSEDRELTRSIVLTPGFAPPEQYQTKSKQGPWTDIYALSATLYNMLTGTKPDESTDRMQDDQVPDVMEVNPEVPEKLSNAVMKGMALRQELRFHSVDELSDAIHERTEVETPKNEIRRKKRRRLIQVLAIAAVLIAGLTVSGIFYIKQYKKTHLDEATLSVWIPYATVGGKDDAQAKEDAKALAEERFRAISSNYRQNYSQITLEITCIPAEEYGDRLKEAEKEGRLPDVYQASGLGKEAYQYAGTLDDFYSEINYDEYYGLEEYHGSENGNLSVPMGVDVPVAYVRRGDGIDLDSIQVQGFDQLKKEPSEGYYISPENYYMILNSLGGDYSYQDKPVLDEKAREMIKEMAGSQYAASNDSEALAGLAEGKFTYYLAGISTLPLVQEDTELAGLYAVRPLSTGKLAADYSDIWCISKDLKDNRKQAAVRLLLSMIGWDGQMAMHVSYVSVLPVNKEAFNKYLELHGNLAFLKDTMSAVSYKVHDRDAERSDSLRMSQEVVVKKSKSIDEWLED